MYLLIAGLGAITLLGSVITYNVVTSESTTAATTSTSTTSKYAPGDFVINHPPSPPPHAVPPEIWDPKESSRGWRANSIVGTYCVLWYGKNLDAGITPELLRSKVETIDFWYLELQKSYGYIMRVDREKKVNTHKLNIYLKNSGLENHPPDGNYVGSYSGIPIGTSQSDIHYHLNSGRYQADVLYIMSDLFSLFHQFAHIIQWRTGGFKVNALWVWESHACYLHHKIEPKNTHLLNMAIDYLRNDAWRMLTIDYSTYYKAWIFWLVIEGMYGSEFIGKLWSHHFSYWRSLFDEIAYYRHNGGQDAVMIYGGDVTKVFGNYLLNIVNLNFGSSTDIIMETGLGSNWKQLVAEGKHIVPFERIYYFNGKILNSFHRLECIFGFVLLDIGSVLPAGKRYKVSLIPLSHEVGKWRAVYNKKILLANEWSEPVEGGKPSIFAVGYGGYEYKNPWLCLFELLTQVV